jgi:Cdc6-like AAA superfamily ATPase
MDMSYGLSRATYRLRSPTSSRNWRVVPARFEVPGLDAIGGINLFCPGMPGAGKTMMATLVIDRLPRSEHGAERPIAFIYCNYKQQSEQSIEHMLSNLLRQVVDIQEQGGHQPIQSNLGSLDWIGW